MRTRVTIALMTLLCLAGCMPEGESGAVPKDDCQIRGNCFGPPPVCRPLDQVLGRCNVA